MKDTTIWADPVLINLPTTPDLQSQPTGISLSLFNEGHIREDRGIADPTNQ